MTNHFSAFFKRNDKLSSGVTLNHRGRAGFGTMLGGCLSMLTWLIFLVFTGLQLYLWWFKPDYAATHKTSYLPKLNPEIYTIETTEYMPTIMVMSLNHATGTVTYNDPLLGSYDWYQINDDDDPNIPVPAAHIASVNCEDLISETSLSDEEKLAFIAELPSANSQHEKAYSICPNMTAITLQKTPGENIVNLNNPGSWLRLDIHTT